MQKTEEVLETQVSEVFLRKEDPWLWVSDRVIRGKRWSLVNDPGAERAGGCCFQGRYGLVKDPGAERAGGCCFQERHGRVAHSQPQAWLQSRSHCTACFLLILTMWQDSREESSPLYYRPGKRVAGLLNAWPVHGFQNPSCLPSTPLLILFQNTLMPVAWAGGQRHVCTTVSLCNSFSVFFFLSIVLL